MAKYFVTSQLSENISETPEGYLLCKDVPITRTGVLEYGEGETPLETGADGIIRMSRGEEDVFNPATMASFEGKSITVDHPSDFVNPDNWQELTVGIVQNVHRCDTNNNLLVADFLITEAKAISLVKNGLREVSCGYEADFTQTGEGTGKQTHILGNHVALVDKGRAGESCAIKDNHNGVVLMLKLNKLKTKLGRVIDEALDETKKKAAADKTAADAKAAKDKKKKEDKADDKSCGSMDEGAIMDAFKKLNDRMDAYEAKGKDDDDMIDDDEADKEDMEKDPAADEDVDDNTAQTDLHSRIEALEAELADLKSKVGGDDMTDDSDKDGDGDDDSDEDGDDDKEDDFFDKTGKVTGDTAARAEILAPGIDLKSKTIKVDALTAALKSKDGKKVIDSLTGGKLDFKNKTVVDTVFISAAEIMKAQRKTNFSSTKKTSDKVHNVFDSGPVTAQDLNEINAKFWANQKK